MGDDLDPFGRKKDENPLASLGWHGDETAGTAPPERTPDPVIPVGAGERNEPGPLTPPRRADPEAAAARWRSPRRRDHRRVQVVAVPGPVGQIVRTLIALGIVIAVGGALIGVFADEGVERAERFADKFAQPDIQGPAVPGASSSDGPGQGARQQRSATGLSADSLLRPAAFGRAIARLRAGGHARLMYLRVAPDRIDATAVTKDGRLRLLQIVPGGAVNVLQTTGGFAGARTMTLKGIDAGAPHQLTRSAAERLEQPASRVDYLVLSEVAGARQWNVYFKGGQIFAADAHGRITRRIS